MSTGTEPKSSADAAKSAPARQFVNFLFFKSSAAFRALDATSKQVAKTAFNEIVERHRKNLMILSYSTVGLKSETDFLLWRIGYDVDPFQQMIAEINRSPMGPFLEIAASYIAMTKHSQYVDEHVHEGQEGRRLKIVPGKSTYLFVYPFVKTRPWYLLPMGERQRMMTDHISIGHKYPMVKINTTYSFGLDDQEFVVAFETESPGDFLDLVQELRETEASSYTLRDTPMYTCVRRSVPEILDELG